LQKPLTIYAALKIVILTVILFTISSVVLLFPDGNMIFMANVTIHALQQLEQYAPRLAPIIATVALVLPVFPIIADGMEHLAKTVLLPVHQDILTGFGRVAQLINVLPLSQHQP